MIKLYNAKKFCKDDISLIENYDKAIADTTQVWHCHHRRETIYSRSGLIEIGEYYNRPACELIFLTKSEHMKLHRLSKNVSAETRKKMSQSKNGKHLSAETRKKLSESLKGKHRSAETRKKISESKKGKHLSAETKRKLCESMNGEKNHNFGKHWYNNGVIQKTFFDDDVPNGFIKGMKASS